MVEYSSETPHSILAPYHQSVLNLMGRSENPVELSGKVMQQDLQTSLMKEQSNKHAEGVIYINAVWLSYLFGDYNRAGDFAEKILKDFSDPMSQMEELIRSLFCGLTWLALAKETKNKKLKKLAIQQMSKFKKWSQHAPFNCLQKLYLLKAEYAVLQKRYSKAERYYDEAILLSRKHGYLNDEALAQERFGIFYSDRLNIGAAHEHLTYAEELYRKWGAQAKVDHVRSEIRAITAS
jgi:tetratricopeptide (TPR) repeat protein